MGMQTDVKASLPLLTTGAVKNQAGDALTRTRVKGIYVVPSGTAGTVTLRNGATGDVQLILNTVASATQPTYLLVPDQGILFDDALYAEVSNIGSVIVFYG